MNKQEYADYVASVEEFFQREGINNLSALPQETDEGEFIDGREPFFSWQPCDCCGRSEGGDRQEANGYNPTTKEVQDGYTVCLDCLYFAEYGQLDDMTMLDVDE